MDTVLSTDVSLYWEFLNSVTGSGTTDDDEPCWSEDEPFTGVYASAYWSSTDGSSSSFAWIVYLHDAYFTPDVKTDRHYVWAVRSF